MPVATATAEEERPKKEYNDFDMSIISAGGGNDFDDYVQLPSEEAFEAYISEIKQGTKLDRESNEELPRVYAWATLANGEGKGQKYRSDFSPSLNEKANLQKFLVAVYGERQTIIDPIEIIGRPVRIELGEPWGDRKMQFIKTFKKPLASQKRVEVAGDTALTADEFDQIIESAGDDSN